MAKDIYICSKPLQYFNIRNIRRPQPEGEDTLIFLNYFIDAGEFVSRVQQEDHTWHRVRLFPNRYRFYLYLLFHHARNLFVEYDSTFFHGLLKALGCFRHMYLFEEGFGSYRKDRCFKAHGLKRWINRLTGVSDWVGQSTFLDGIYLYMPELYRRQFPHNTKPLIPFMQPFVTRLTEELPLFLKLSDGYEEYCAIKNRKIGIYLTSHEINEKIIGMIQSEREQFDLLFIKPHPHLKNIDSLKQYNIPVVRSNLMMEFLIVILLNNGNRLTIYHENSTVVIWFQDMIDNRNEGTKFEEYEIVVSYIKQLNKEHINTTHYVEQ